MHWMQFILIGNAIPLVLPSLVELQLEKHGHLNVKQAEGKSLADFSTNIRTSRKNHGKKGFMKTTEDRIASLDAIGFVWKLECTQEKAAAK